MPTTDEQEPGAAGTVAPPPGASGPKPYVPYVPEVTDLREVTVRAIVIGLVMTVLLGAANAYLGLRAGMTIAATYPAAVVGMALLRLLRKSSILEENLARTIGSIGESIATGAVFTIPAFVISGAWGDFSSPDSYRKTAVLMVVGGLLGILFVALLRRVMIEDQDLPFPESVAASEIHKAGQRGYGAARNLIIAMGVGAAVYVAGAFRLFSASREFVIQVGTLGKSLIKLSAAKLAPGAVAPAVKAGGIASFQAPSVSPAYFGVGYIVGPELSSLNFAGGLLAWGLFVPLLMYLLGPQLQALPMSDTDKVVAVWKFIVRPIAVGGMLVGAATTLYRMRKSLATGMKRAVRDLRRASGGQTGRLDRDLDMKVVFGGLGACLVCMVAVYFWFTGAIGTAATAAIVMIITGFFFAAVSGNLVGTIGSSNNPVSGIALSALIIAALMLVVIGATGSGGVAAVLGVAAVVCISSTVAGEMFQDLKVGHILGGTPSRMEGGDILGVVVAGSVMYFPLVLLHQANITAGGTGFGDPKLPAPQAGLMAALAQGIVGGEMAWPLVVVGIVMGIALVLVRVRSPMVFAMGMYLPLETTSAIFVGGVIRWVADRVAARRALDPAQQARVDETGVLVASGFIAGEALMGLVVAAFVMIAKQKLPTLTAGPWAAASLADWLAPLVALGLAFYMIATPLRSASAAKPR
jgi:putative OPT family oligopeptide transporter